MRGSRTAAVVIPARLGSRRFPRKVLARETGKYLVQHVWEAVQGCPAVARVIVATDSSEVEEAVRSFGGHAVRTSAEHLSGTDRVAEVARGLDDEYIINVQGDEPQISTADLRRLIELLDGSLAGPGSRPDRATLVVPRSDPEGFRAPDVVKAVVAGDGRALYFSRSPVPHAPVDEPPPVWWQHLGVYGYRREFLLRFAGWEPAPLEQRERLEQLRALERGSAIHVGEASGPHVGIDTPEEYRSFVEEYLRGRSAREDVKRGASPDGPARGWAG